MQLAQKKEESIKKEIEIALERVRLQLNDLNKVAPGSKKEESIKQEIEMALERIRLQLNDLNKVAPEELEYRVKSILEDKINDLEVGVNKRKVMTLPTPRQELSVDS